MDIQLLDMGFLCFSYFLLMYHVCIHIGLFYLAPHRWNSLPTPTRQLEDWQLASLGHEILWFNPPDR